MEEPTAKLIEDAVQRAFSSSVQEGRYIDVSRIPLICQSMVQISKDLTAVKEQMVQERTGLVTQDQFWPVKTLVYGLVGLTLVAVVKIFVDMALK